MVQEFDLTPGRDRRRTRLGLGCGLLLLLLLCLGAAVAGGSALYRSLVAEPGLTPAATTATGNSPALNRIAYVDPAGQIGTVAPDGSDNRLLTSDSDGIFLFPAWSPDGQQLAAIGSDEAGGSVVVLADAPAGEAAPRQLYYSEQQSPFYLYWSPDSRRISFLANHPSGIALQLVAADGQSASTILSTGQPFYWNWTASSDQLFIHTGLTEEDARLAFLDVEGPDSSENLARPGFFQAPGISSDGRYVAYAERDEAEARWLIVQDSAAGEVVQRLPHWGLTALSWSPSAPQLAFVAPDEPGFFDAGFYGSLRLLDVATGEVRTLAQDLVLAFFWSPDGQSIAYLTLAGDEEGVTAARPGSSKPPRAAKQAQQDIPLRLNLVIVDVASGQGRALLTFTPTGLFLRQFLPFFDQYALSHRIWSPDSSALVLPVQDGGVERIYVVDALSGAAQPVVRGSIAFWSQQ